MNLKVRPARLERATFWFVAKRSIQLSYGRLLLKPKSIKMAAEQLITVPNTLATTREILIIPAGKHLCKPIQQTIRLPFLLTGDVLPFTAIDNILDSRAVVTKLFANLWDSGRGRIAPK